MEQEIEYGDLYLKFASEDEAMGVLFSDGVCKYNVALDLIGVIYKPTGEMLQSEDGEYPEMGAVTGWHVNTRGEKHPDLLAYAVEVNTPIRVWA